MGFESEYSINLAGSLDNLKLLADGIERIEGLAKSSSKATSASFQAGASAASDFTRELANGVKIYDTIGTSAEAFGDEIKRLSDLYEDTKKRQKEFIAEGKFDQYKQNIDGLKARIKELGGELEDAGDSAEKAGKQIDFKKQLADGTKIFQPITKDAKSFEDELKRLNQVYKDLIAKEKDFVAQGRYDELQQNVSGLKERASQLGGEIEGAGEKTSKLGGVLKGAGAAFIGLFAVDKLLETGQEMVRLTGEFEQFSAVLGNTLGDKSEAQNALFLIQDFAAKTPFSVAQLTESYVKLTNQGIQPTRKELTALGDLASSTGKPFDQLTEAVLDAVTGENERLKEFGITARKQGDQTAYTFKGTTTVVKNTSVAIKEYLVSLGSIAGVSGSMAVISGTLNGQLSNLGDSWDRLLVSVGKTGGVLASSAGFLSDIVSAAADAVTSVDDLAQRQTADETLAFIEAKTTDFKKTIRALQKQGKDFDSAIANTVDSERNKLKESLENAKIASKSVREIAEQTAFSQGPIAYIKYKLNPEVSVDAQVEVAKIQGQVDGLGSAAKKAADLIKKEDDAAQVAADKAAADAAKKAKAAREKAIKEYAAELLKLEKEADKARIEMLDKDSEEYVEAVRKQSQKEIDTLVAELEKKKKAATGDGTLTTSQKSQVQILRDNVNQKYQEDLVNLSIKTNDRILDLQKDSDDKELAQLQAKFYKEITAARKAKNERLALALEEAQSLAEAALVRTQALKNIDTRETLNLNSIDTGKETPTLPTLDVTADQSEAERAMSQRKSILDRLKTMEVDAEKTLQKARLQAQIDANNERLLLYQNDFSDEATVIKSNLEKANKELYDQMKAIKETAPKLDILKLLGVADEDKEKVKQAFSTFASSFLGSLSEMFSAEVQLTNERVSAAQQGVTDAQKSLSDELALRQAGYASNVEGARAELEEQRKIKAQAVADQKKALQAQQLLETAEQTVGLITASVEVIKGFSHIPIIGLPLGIAAVAAMFGAFFAAKSKAAQLTKAEKGTTIRGKRHSEGGEKFYHESGLYGYELEADERVTNRRSSIKHAPLLDAINDDDMVRIRQLAFDLEGTGVSLSREPVEQAKATQNIITARLSTPRGDSSKLDKIEGHLRQISANTTPRTKAEYDAAGNRVETTGNHRRVILKKND